MYYLVISQAATKKHSLFTKRMARFILLNFDFEFLNLLLEVIELIHVEFLATGESFEPPIKQNLAL